MFGIDFNPGFLYKIYGNMLSSQSLSIIWGKKDLKPNKTMLWCPSTFNESFLHIKMMTAALYNVSDCTQY